MIECYKSRDEFKPIRVYHLSAFKNLLWIFSKIDSWAVWPDGYIIFRYLAISNNENKPNNVPNLPKKVHHFAK